MLQRLEARGPVLIALVVATTIVLVLELVVGPVQIPLGDLAAILVGAAPENPAYADVVLRVRLPRALTAAAGGAALACGGLILQTLFRNPLAGPWALGITSGARLGVALVVVAGAAAGTNVFVNLGVLGNLGLAGGAFLGSVAVLAIVTAIARRVSGMSLLIVGLMIYYLAEALTGFVLHFTTVEQVRVFAGWDDGSFHTASVSQLWILLPVVAIGLAGATALSKSLNAFLLGEQYARTLGVHVARTRVAAMTTMIALAGTVTAYCGPLMFLDIAVPHLCRGLFRTSDHRVLLPATAAVGALIAVSADLIVHLPWERHLLHLNYVNALIGAPVVLWVTLRQRSGHLLAMASLVLVVAGCRPPAVPRASDERVSVVTGALTSNITDGRVDRFDPALDYFPEKISIEYAKGFRVEYRGHYKIVTIDLGAPGSPTERFALVQRGTPAPEGFPPDRVIGVPVDRFAVLSFPWEGLVDELDLETRLVAVYSDDMTTAPPIRKLIAERRIEEVGCCAHVNVEALAVTRPDVVVISITRPDPATPLLAEAGIRTVRASYNWESSMLARAEWSKFFALLFNREADAQARFAPIAARYEELAARAAAVPVKPGVVVGYPAKDRWVASWEFLRFVKDAGGISFMRPPEELSVNVPEEMAFEEALARGRDAPVWVFLPDFVGSFGALLGLEQRLSLMTAVRNHAVYDVCLGCGEGTGSPYWTEYLVRPERVLADLIHILHPQLLPDHRLSYLRRTPGA
jgi:iron complex transport system permease protein